MKRRILSEKERLAAISMAKKGMSSTEIGEVLGYSGGTIKSYLWRAGVERKPPTCSGNRVSFRIKSTPKWDFSKDNLDLQYR